MGLFSRKRTVSVASVSYNLAGDINDRVRFLPTVIMSHIIRNSASSSMADSIIRSLLNGYGVKFRSFGKWAIDSGYMDLIGQSQGKLIKSNEIDLTIVASNIVHNPDEIVVVQTSEIRHGDYGYWADQWMSINLPDRIDDEYTIDFNEGTNTITITLDSGSTIHTFNPINFDPYSEYLYTSYLLQKENQLGDIVVGSIVYDSFPDTTGWTLDDTITTPQTALLHTHTETTITYSDSTPPEYYENDYDTSTDWNDIETVYHNDTYMGQDISIDRLYSNRDIQHNFTNQIIVEVTSEETTVEDIGGGVTKTTTVVTTQDELQYEYSYRIDTREVIYIQYGKVNIDIYKKGDDNSALDALFNNPLITSDYFPFIPIRYDNSFVTGSIETANVKAIKKALSTKYSTIVSNVADNPSLGDIDYAYVIFGVPINTKENASKKYLFNYFDKARINNLGNQITYASWKTQWDYAHSLRLAWITWKEAQSDIGNILYNTPEPSIIPYPPKPNNRLSLSSNLFNLNIVITWSFISKTNNFGLSKPDAEVGEYWLELVESTEEEIIIYSGGSFINTANVKDKRSVLNIHRQVSESFYETLTIKDLFHTNIIYEGKSVDITLAEAMNDPDESGFILPLDQTIYRSMSLKDSTQMANSVAYMLFNCYTVTKQKWYQTSLFKVVIIIIAVIIAVVSYGSGSNASTGLLGSASSVGAALGFAGVAAVIVGTIANTIAAMIVAQIIMSVSTTLLGDKIGSIVGAIVAVVAIALGSAPSGSTASIGTVFTTISNPQVLMQLTSAALNGVSSYFNFKIRDALLATQDIYKEYERQSKLISDLWQSNLGFGKTYIDPLGFTDTSKENNQLYVPESLNTFLDRTLLLGSDIVDITHNMLTNFTQITLDNSLLI